MTIRQTISLFFVALCIPGSSLAAGDKVDFSDPSAAPLGTDDEAGTNSVDPAQLRHAKAAETAHGPTKGAARHVAETDKAGPADLQRSRHPAWMPWAAVAVIVVAVALYLMGGS